MNVVILDGERTILVKLAKKKSTEKDLRQAFLKLAPVDPVWKTWMSTHYPTFQTYREKYKIFSELMPAERLIDGQQVKIIFLLFAPLETSPEPQIGETRQRTSTEGHSATALGGNTVMERDWLKKIGVKTVSSEARVPAAVQLSDSEDVSGLNMDGKGLKSVDVNANSESKENENDNSLDTDTDTASEKDKSSGDENEYTQANVTNRRENLKRIQTMNIVPPKGPKLRKKRQPKKKGKENQPLEAVEVRRSSRIASESGKKQAALEMDLFASESSDPDDDLETPEAPKAASSDAPPLGPSTVAKDKVKSKKKCSKVKHRFGERITKHTPLPAFTAEVKLVIKKGIGEQDQADSAIINKFMAAHVLNQTKGIQLSKGEYKVLRKQLRKRLEKMKLDQFKEFSIKIVYALSVHLRNERRKEKRKLKQAAERAAKREASLKEAANKAQDTPSTSNMDSTVNGDLDDDDILRKPVINKSTVKLALCSSSTRFALIQSMSVRDAMTTYPYLKCPELVIEDYLTRVSMSIDKAEENLDNIVLPFKMVFDIELVIENELDKLKIILKMDEHFTDNPDSWPLFQFCDEGNQRAAPLDHIPVGQSPAMVLLKNDKDITSATIVFDGEALLTLKKPTSFQSVALLMAMYFIFDLEYPTPYMKQLRILEIIIHGEKLSNENIAVQKFMEKVRTCQQIVKDR